MPNILTIGQAEKAAGDTVRIACDFGDEPLLISGYHVTAHSVSCTGTGAPAVSSEQMDYSYQLSALFTGGTAGVYSAVYSITLDDPDVTILVRTGSLKVY